jgi:hypothetical protein
MYWSMPPNQVNVQSRAALPAESAKPLRPILEYVVILPYQFNSWEQQSYHISRCACAHGDKKIRKSSVPEEESYLTIGQQRQGRWSANSPLSALVTKKTNAWVNITPLVTADVTTESLFSGCRRTVAFTLQWYSSWCAVHELWDQRQLCTYVITLKQELMSRWNYSSVGADIPMESLLVTVYVLTKSLSCGSWCTDGNTLSDSLCTEKITLLWQLMYRCNHTPVEADVLIESPSSGSWYTNGIPLSDSKCSD